MLTHRFLFGSSPAIEGTVYGTIIAMSVITAGSGHDGVGAGRLAVLVASTAVVLWLAHVYAHALGESLETKTRLTLGRLSALAKRESAVPLAALGPTIVLALGGLGVLRDATAGWIAVGLGVATLGFVGLRYAQIERLGRTATLVSISVNLALGLVIVGLKAGVTH